MSKFTAILGAALIAMSFSGTAHADDDMDKMVKKGEKVFKKCKACHAVGEGAANKVGPQLNNLIGRKAGAAEGFEYSDGFKAKAAAGLVWNEETLAAFLESPRDYVEGTKMAFAGLRKDKDRDAIVAYFKSMSAPAAEAPKADK